MQCSGRSRPVERAVWVERLRIFAILPRLPSNRSSRASIVRFMALTAPEL